jgi:hypothetical protein
MKTLIFLLLLIPLIGMGQDVGKNYKPLTPEQVARCLDILSTAVDGLSNQTITFQVIY